MSQGAAPCALRTGPKPEDVEIVQRIWTEKTTGAALDATMIAAGRDIAVPKEATLARRRNQRNPEPRLYSPHRPWPHISRAL
jgi:hypothetical protein